MKNEEKRSEFLSRIFNAFSLFIKREALYLFFLLASVFIATINIGGKYEINFINVQWPINASLTFDNLFRGITFSNYGTVGFISIFNLPEISSIYLLNLLGLPVYIQEIILISVTQFISLVFFYKIFFDYMFSYIGEQNKKLFVSALASSLTVFSYASQVLFWWNFIPQGFFLLAFGSGLIFYEMKFFENYLRGVASNEHLLFIFVFSSLSISVNTPFNISFLWMILIMPLFVIVDNFYYIKIRKIVYSYLITMLLIFLANLWVIFPTILETTYIPFSNISSINDNLSIFYAIGAVNPGNILYFTFATSQYSYPSLGTGIFETTGLILSYLILPLIFGGIISLERKSNRKYFILLGVYIITFLLIIGSGGPLKYLYLDIIFRNGDLLTALRNPYTAFIFAFNILYILLLISSGYRIILSIHSYIERIKTQKSKTRNNKFAKIISASIILLLVIPVFATSSSIYFGEAIPSNPLHSRVEVPAYEIHTANFVKTMLNCSAYVLIYPGGGLIDENWTHGYDGSDLLPNLINSNYVIDFPTNNLQDLIYQYIGNGKTNLLPNFASELSNMGIKYIVIEGNVTASPYWSYTFTPNYKSILNSINHTKHIVLLKRFFSNYVYENTLNTSLLYIPSTLVNSRDTIDGIIPIDNITKTFYNDMQRNYSLSPENFINSTYDKSIFISINESDRNETEALEGHLPFSYQGYGGPVVFNQYPLNISPINNYLIIKFRTNRNAAFGINAITTPNTTGDYEYLYYLAKNDSIFGLDGSSNSLGFGDANLSSYGLGIFTNTNITNMVIDLNAVTNKTIYKLLFEIYPVSNNGSPPANASNLPPYENLTIYSIEIGKNMFDLNNTFILSNQTFIPCSRELNLNASITSVKINGEHILLNVNLNAGDNSPIPVILTESYIKGWKVRYNENASAVTIINNNYSTLILLFPDGHGNNISLYLYLSGNQIFKHLLFFSLLMYISSLMLLVFPIIYRFCNKIALAKRNKTHV